jgi:hypothetical protein
MGGGDPNIAQVHAANCPELSKLYPTTVRKFCHTKTCRKTTLFKRKSHNTSEEISKSLQSKQQN